MMKSVACASIIVCLMVAFGSPCAGEEVPLEGSGTIQPQLQPGSGKSAGAATGAQTQMEEMVVTATLLPTPTKEVPVPVQIITRKEIEESRANDLSELLTEYLPEPMQKYPGALSSMSIRGFRTNTTGSDIKGHVLVLIDGHRAGTGNVATLPLDNVERIEIVRGPGSVIYGSAAMGGVVNLITRKGKGSPSLIAGVEGGSWDYIKGYGGVSGGILNDRVGFSFTGRTMRQGSYDMGGGPKVPNTGYNDEAYSLSLQATPHPDHTFSAVGNYYHGFDIGTPDPDYFPTNETDSKRILRGYGSVAYDGAFPACGFNWHLSYYNVYDKPTYFTPLATYGYTSSTYLTEMQGVRSTFSLPTFSFGELLVGFQWDGIEAGSSTEPTGFNYSPNSHYDNYALLAEQKIKWDKLTVLLGVRYDIFDEATKPTPGLDVVSQSETFDHASWRGGLTYSFFDWLTGRAAVGTGFRAPTADELSGRYQSGSWMKIVGNPSLKPETSTTFDIGADVDYRGFRAGLGWFYTKFTDAISSGFPATVDGDTTWTTFRNVEGAIYSAFEATLSYKKPFTICDLPMHVRPYMNLAVYTQRELQDEDYQRILVTDIAPYVPEWDLTGGIELDFNRKVNLLFTGAYMGAQKVQDWNFLSPTYQQAIDKGGFMVLGARLSIRPVKYFDLYLSVDNLTDKNYAFVDGYPMPGRTFRAGLQAHY